MNTPNTYRLISQLPRLTKNIYIKQFSKSSNQAAAGMTEKPIEKSIQEKLKFRLKPVHLNIINESYQHNVPKGSETHFKVVVVAEEFENMPLLKRHRLVNMILEEELKKGVHALSIVAKAPSQWVQNEVISPSPKCLGGFGK